MQNQEMMISVARVTPVKKNKKGSPFISVQDPKGDWWYVGEKKLFPLFQEGATLECVVSDTNDFKRIEDVIVEDMRTKSASTQPSATGENPQLTKVIEGLRSIWKVLDERLPKAEKNPLDEV